MLAYGLPRHPDIQCPDLLDLHTYALKSSLGRLGRGDKGIRNTVGSSSAKRLTRILWKKKARNEAKLYIQTELKDYYESTYNT